MKMIQAETRWRMALLKWKSSVRQTMHVKIGDDECGCLKREIKQSTLWGQTREQK